MREGSWVESAAASNEARRGERSLPLARGREGGGGRNRATCVPCAALPSSALLIETKFLS